MKSLIILALVLAACGRQHDTSTPAAAPTAAATTPATDPALEGSCGSSRSCVIRGSVIGAFAITVDGKPYSDIEGFYTYELDDLKRQAAAEGYPDADFSAQLGLRDIALNMNVYVENVTGTGFAGSGIVNGATGGFIIHDVDFSDTPAALFNVRVVKRITLSTSDAEFCWNFSGSSTDVPVNQGVLINSYSTSFTKYACTGNDGGMSLPVKTTVTPK